MGMIANGGHDKVRAVDSDHSTLGEPRAWIVFLYNGVDTEEGNDDGKGKIKRDEKLVECAARACEVRVQHASHGKGCHIHARGRTDENPLPEIGIAGILPILETSLRPGVSEVHQEDQPEKDEESRADERDVVSPEHKKAIWDEERYDDKHKPEQGLRPPPTIVL